MNFKKRCPGCGEPLEVWVDLSEGPPAEAGTECDCGCIPVWGVDWSYDVWLTDFRHDEREYVRRLNRSDNAP